MKIMGNIQDKICQLLKEIRDICREEDIRYYLGGWTALTAYCKGYCEEDMLLGHMMIWAKDANRLIDAIEKRKMPNRSLDHLKKNPNFPGFFLRYTAEDTTAFEKYHYKGFRNHGISVHICFLSSVLEDEQKRKRYDLLEQGMLSRFGDDRLKTKREIAAKQYALMSLKKYSPEKLFDEWVKVHSAPSKRVFCRTKLKPRFSYEGERTIFDATRDITLNGISFSMPEDRKGFFKDLYKRYYTVVFAEGIKYPDMVISTEISYKEYFKTLGQNPVKSMKEMEKIDEKRLLGAKEFKDAKQYIDQTWYRLNVVQKRFALQKIYDGDCLKQIRQCYDSGDYEEVYRILKPWQEMNQYCEERKINREKYVVNPELDQLVEELGIGFGLPS